MVVIQNYKIEALITLSFPEESINTYNTTDEYEWESNFFTDVSDNS